MGLEGRVAIVTGAGGEGMGRSIALTLARDGADIAVNYRSKRDGADAVVGSIEAMGRRAIAIEGDVSDEAAVDALVTGTAAQLGAPDIAIVSAGAPWKPQDIVDIDPAHFRRVLSAEVESAFLMIRATLPQMRARGWGRIVMIGGHVADTWRFGPPEAPFDYPLGKAARHWLARTLGPRELAHGVTINAVAPGPTPRINLERALASLRGERVGPHTPQDIADVVAYLCSDAASGVSGAVVPVPGEREV